LSNRFEDKESGVVVMWEISPLTSHADRESRYKIGDGGNLNYAFESFDMLERFVQMLRGLVWGKFVAEKFHAQF
jgi:hypothetical protein